MKSSNIQKSQIKRYLIIFAKEKSSLINFRWLDIIEETLINFKGFLFKKEIAYPF